MDGSNPAQIVSGLDHAYGIAVDLKEWRVYWAAHEWGGDDCQLQSSDLQGGNIKNIVVRTNWNRAAACGIGIGFLGDRLCVSYHNGTLESFTKSGQDPQVLYEGYKNLQFLATVPTLSPTLSRRTNDCQNVYCLNLCVLTPIPSKCLPSS